MCPTIRCILLGLDLSYTNFEYSDLKLSSKSLNGNQVLTASITVKNTGSFAGKEIVQLYIRDLVGSVTRPVKELKGFEKIQLAPGESKTVNFRITPELLKFYNSELRYDWEPGEFEIMAGPNSRDVKKETITWKK